MESDLIYNFRDFYEVQLQAKITNFMVQINDKNLLGRLTNIRLLQLQSREFLHVSPLLFWPHRKIKAQHQKSFFHSLLTLCFRNNFSFDVSLDKRNQILGGIKDLRSILGTNMVPSFVKSMRNQFIMYYEQITTLDGQYLLDWPLIRKKQYADIPSRRKPKW